MITALVVSLVVCFIINVPVSFSLGLATVVAVIVAGSPSQLIILPQRLIASMDSFPLLAIPLFMVAGAVMETGGVSRRIVNFAASLVGHIRGGLGFVSIIACTIFAAISGSTPATAAAIGSITLPEMKKRSYPMDFSSAVVASSACLGVIIPPSITMVIVGVAGDISVGKMLIGGIIPGLILSALLVIVNFVYARKLKLPAEERRNARERLRAFVDSLWALIMPIIILGGIMTGIFTPTESAAIAVAYGLFVSFFVYKEMSVKDLIPCFVKASLNSAMIMWLIGMAGVYGWLITACNVPKLVQELLLSISTNLYVIYAIVLLFLLFLGCFMEAAAIIMLVIPFLAPVMKALGADMVAFGVVAVIDLAIGMATPPVGISLFATCSISKISIGEISSRILPFLGVLIFGLFLIMFFPRLASWLPDLLIR